MCCGFPSFRSRSRGCLCTVCTEFPRRGARTPAPAASHCKKLWASPFMSFLVRGNAVSVSLRSTISPVQRTAFIFRASLCAAVHAVISSNIGCENVFFVYVCGSPYKIIENDSPFSRAGGFSSFTSEGCVWRVPQTPQELCSACAAVTDSAAIHIINAAVFIFYLKSSLKRLCIPSKEPFEKMRIIFFAFAGLFPDLFFQLLKQSRVGSKSSYFSGVGSSHSRSVNTAFGGNF